MITIERICPKCGTALLDGALEGLCRKCLGSFAFSLGDAGNEATETPGLRRLGDYELLEEIARGGMGVVYKARQLSLNRIVALKVVLHGPFSSEEFVRRFRTETEAVAGLQHPNIVAIYEVGEQDGHHYFSMEYIEGQNLAELVREKPLPARRAAGYVKTIAEAIHYAHEKGILHRDLKPSNLLLDIFDQPRITDFGLAKLLNRDLELTTTGQVLGSPNYMPPEQAAGKLTSAAPPGDVYSLGAILYHLLTGRPPFQGEMLQEILQQVQNATPVSLCRLNPSVPQSLQTICLKCLQKEPAKRYSSAKKLAEDLGRFLANEPIHARPVAPAQKLWLWCRRRPVVSALAAALLLAVALGLVGVLWQWQRAESHAQGESQLRRLAEASAARLRLNLYAADVSLAWQAIGRGDYGLARRTLAGLHPRAGEPDLRGFEWRYLWNLCQGDQLATLTGHKWVVTSAAFSPDGRLLATSSQDGTTKIWEVERRQLITTVSGNSTGAVWSAAFSPDGGLLITAGPQSVCLWDTGTWQCVTSFPGQIAAVSKTGSLVAVSESGPFYWQPAGKVTLWDYHSGKKLRQFDQPGRALALSAGGRNLAIAGETNGVDLWDLASGKLQRTLPTEKPVWSLNFSPAGNQLAAAGWSSEVLVWNLASGQPPEKLKGHELTVWSATFSPDGSTLITTGSDQTIRLWDATTLRLKNILHGHESEIWCAAFSPDGKLLATGGKDQNVLLWSTEPRVSRDSLPNANYIRPFFSPDGTRLVTAGTKTRSALWDVPGRTRIAEHPDDHVFGFSPDGTQIVSWDANEIALRFWSPGSSTSKRVNLAGIGSDTREFHNWGFSPAWDIFFAIDHIGLVRFWETRSGKLLGSLRGPAPPIQSVALGPDGTYLALSVELENTIRLYERSTGRAMQLSGHQDFVSGLAFSPDGATLASGSMDGSIRLWDTATGRQLAALPGHMQEATDVAFSPDGRTLASVGHLESVKLWHLPTQRELLSLNFPKAGRYLQFSPDGRHLAVATEENSVRLFDAPAVEERNGTNR